MRYKQIATVFLILFLSLSGLILAQQEQGSWFSQSEFRPTFGIFYFSRSVVSGEEATVNRISSYYFSLIPEFEFSGDFIVSPIIGYSFSNYDEIAFRELPVSLELDVGDMGGPLLGLELTKGFLRFRNVEVDLNGRILFFLGNRNTWPITGLAVEGQAKGKPTWMSVRAGPVISYTGFAFLRPYVTLSYDKLWGTFRMEELIKDLTGEEKKKLDGESYVSLNLGISYDAIKNVTIRLNMLIAPHADFRGIDYGIGLFFIYFFQ